MGVDIPSCSPFDYDEQPGRESFSTKPGSTSTNTTTTTTKLWLCQSKVVIKVKKEGIDI